ALFALAQGLRDEGQFRLSIVAATRATSAAGVGPAAAPRALRELIYPAYFGSLVLEQSRAFGVDPRLLLALIRQESLFDPRAGSSVGARGLTQVMPATGQEIADALGVGD